MTGSTTTDNFDFEGISPDELAVLMSGDDAAMESAFKADLHADLDSGEIDQAAERGDTDDDDSDVIDQVAQPGTVAKPANSDEGAAPGAASDDDPEKGQAVLAADGKTLIPYQVLKSTRQEARELREQLAETQASSAEQLKQLEFMQRKLTLFEKQLTNAQLTPEKLAEEIEITQELIDSAGEYGEAGKLILAMHSRLESLQAQLQGSPSTKAQPVDNGATHTSTNDDDAVNAAINANADLAAWRDRDEDRWADAVSIDNRLMNDPKWKGQPYEARFAEVTKRVKAMYGEPVVPSLQQLQQKIETADAGLDAPQSLSQVGQGNSRAEKRSNLDSMSEEQIIDAYSSVSLEDLESDLAPYF